MLQNTALFILNTVILKREKRAGQGCYEGGEAEMVREALRQWGEKSIQKGRKSVFV